MKAEYLWFGLAVLLLGGALSLPYLGGRRVRTRTTTTVSRIAEVLTDIDLLDQGRIDELRRAAESGASSLMLNQKLGVVFRTSQDEEITAGRLLSADGLFEDAWGTPLLFMFTNSALYGRLEPELKGKARILAVWSAGPNKKDEFGGGDDVVSFR